MLEISLGISAPGAQRVLKMCIWFMQSIGCCYDNGIWKFLLSPEAVSQSEGGRTYIKKATFYANSFFNKLSLL